jgi:hypothetical protein
MYPDPFVVEVRSMVFLKIRFSDFQGNTEASIVLYQEVATISKMKFTNLIRSRVGFTRGFIATPLKYEKSLQRKILVCILSMLGYKGGVYLPNHITASVLESSSFKKFTPLTVNLASCEFYKNSLHRIYKRRDWDRFGQHMDLELFMDPDDLCGHCHFVLLSRRFFERFLSRAMRNSF